jgi:tetratricopeptide (TPR) repeat protein
MLQILFSLLCAWPIWAQQTEQLEKDLAASPNRVRTRMQLAQLYGKSGQYDKVITLLNSYTDQLPPEGFLALASSYSNKKDFTNEIRVLGLLTAKYEDDYRWRMLSGQAYLKAADAQTAPDKKQEFTTSAIQQLRKARQLQPKYKPAYDLLLTTLQTNKLNNEARELLIEGLSKFGERPEILRDLCRLDSTDGFLVQAVNNCRAAIRAAPGFPDNYVYLVQSLHDQKEDQKAEKDVVVAARRFPRSEFVQWAAGMLFLRKKNYPVAVRYFKASLTADSKSGRGHFGLAQAMFESGEEAASLEHFITACQTLNDAPSVDVFLAAGGKLKQKGNYKLGEQFIQKANTCRK